MKKLLLIALLIVGAFAEGKNLSKIKFDPITGESINSDSINKKFDPITGEIFSLDTLNKTTISNNVYRNKNNNQVDNQAYQFYKKYKYYSSGPIFSFTKLKYNNKKNNRCIWYFYYDRIL